MEDLDVALMRVREPQSRLYMGDAIKAYRVGAYRPSISAAWVALAFDLIQKYRELSALGDGEATTFITDWDNAVVRDDRSKLLKMEGGLLDHAYNKMSMFNASGLLSLERLREDRHTSAHPAFVSADELYEPSDEQTRTHLYSAMTIVLEQRPVRGRGIIDAFGADLISPGFPTSHDAALNYIEQKYIAHMRPGTVKNFGTVLAKSAMWESVEGWVPHVQKVILALVTIEQRRPDHWTHVEADIVRMVNDDNPQFRSNALMLVGWFPQIVSLVAPTISDALAEHCRNSAVLLQNPRSFYGVAARRFEQDILNTFVSLDVDEKSAVISVAPMPSFWPAALTEFKLARSFRQAEYLFDALISPYVTRLTADGLTEVFSAVAANGQIWSASGILPRLMDTLDVTQRLPSWDAVDNLYRATHLGAAIDPGLFERLEALGWQRPAKDDQAKQ
jgi:hypothetical protein